MDNNMLKIDVSSKAVETFIDAISRGIGVLYEPTRIRKEAKAKAEEKVILAKAGARNIGCRSASSWRFCFS